MRDPIFPEKYFTMTESPIYRIRETVTIKDAKGKVKEMKFTSDARTLYSHLKSYINVRKYKTTGEYTVSPSQTYVGNILGWSRKKVGETYTMLIKLGLIEKIIIPGRPFEIKFNGFEKCNILFDLRDESGEYVHTEIKSYIEWAKSGLEVMQEIDPFTQMILDALKHHDDITPYTFNRFWNAVRSGKKEDWELLRDAKFFAEQKKSVTDFIDHLEDEINKDRAHPNVVFKVPFYNWLEDRG